MKVPRGEREPVNRVEVEQMWVGARILRTVLVVDDISYGPYKVGRILKESLEMKKVLEGGNNMREKHFGHLWGR